MAIKDIMQKVQGWVDKVAARREDGQGVPMTTMPNGSVSGYQPRVSRPRAQAEVPETHPAASFAGMTPAGVDPAGIPQYFPPMQATARQSIPQAQGAPQQPYGNQASSRPMPPPQQPFGTVRQNPVPPMGTMRQAPVQQPQQGYQPRHQSPQPQQNAWQNGFTQQQSFPQQGYTPPVQPAPQAAPAPESNVRYFPGTMADEAGNPCAVVLRVAQITSIASCYYLLEFMQNDEAVIVNAEQITDVMEANRCMDMLFGAAYAMNQTFERISGKMIYLIAPRRVHVLPCESMLQVSQQDIERRWPGFSRAGSQEGRHARREDFAPAFGQRAAAPQQAQYDFGSFGGFAGRR